MLVHQQVLALGLERDSAAQEFVQHTAQRVQVGLRGDAATAGLLGCHVLVRADGTAGGGQFGDVSAQDRSDAEVEHLHGAIACDEDVAGLEVAVDHRDVVRVRQDGRDLRGDGDRPADRQGSPGAQTGGQGHAVDQLHHQEQPFVRGVEHRVVHLRHARVLDAGGDAGLAAEALGELLGQLGEVTDACRMSFTATGRSSTAS